MQRSTIPVALVIVHYKSVALVHDLLESSIKWTVQPSKIIVVDNSGDFKASFVPVEILRPGYNSGYAGALNIAVDHLKQITTHTPHLLVCTQDALLEPKAVSHLLNTLSSDNSIGLCAPILRYRDTPDRLFSGGGHLSANGVTSHFEQGKRVTRAHLRGRPYDVDFADGAVLLIASELLRDAHTFPEEYFLYVEEVDFQIRLRSQGHRVVLVPSAVGYQSPGNFKTYLRYRNSLYFTYKYSDSFSSWPWKRMILRDIARICLGRRIDVRDAWRGIRDAKNGKMGPPKDA